MTHKNIPDGFTEDFNSMMKIIRWNSVGFFFLDFLIPIIARQNMIATGLQVGILVSITVIGLMISSFFVGIITDRTKSKKNLILIGSFGRGISYFIIYLSFILNSLMVLLLSRFVLGLMVGMFWVPFDTLIAEKSNKDNRAQAYGKRNAALAQGLIIGAMLGFLILLITSTFTKNPIIIYSAIPLFGISNFIGGIKFMRNVDESIKFSDSSVFNNSSPLESEGVSNQQIPNIIFVGLFFLMLMTLVSSINGTLARPFLNVYIIENIESDIFWVTMAYFPAGLIATLLAPKLGKIVDNISPSIGMTITFILGALMTWFLINTSILWVFALILLIDITIIGTGSLVFQNLLSRVNLKHRGKVLGFSSFFTNCGQAIGPILGGLAWDAFGSKAPFIISIFVELSLIPLFWLAIYFLMPNLQEKYKSKEETNI